MKKASGKWSPTSLEINIAQIIALRDVIPSKNDVLFVHAPPYESSLDKILLLAAINSYEKGQVKKIIINGLSKELCNARNGAYCGYKKWLKFLLSRGIPRSDIIITPPAFHTADESIQLLTLAKKNKWKRIIIASHPHHQLRCFLQAIAIMQEINYWPNIYNLTHEGISWHQVIKKTVLDDMNSTVQGTFEVHIISEFERLIKYAQEPKTANHIRHATIPEMLDYLNLRK